MITTVGWLSRLHRSAKFRLHNRISSFYRQHLLPNERLAQVFPFKQPPILLISYPRSGSSWIGKMLGFSPEIAYLREPIHQAFQQRFKVQALLDPQQERSILCCHRHFDDEMLRHYKDCAKKTFKGVVPYLPVDIVDNEDDFRLFNRSGKSLLIKEINPLMTGYLVKCYAPRVIVLLRHPAAIAQSFRNLGWLDSTSFEEFGFLYGVHMSEAIEAAAAGQWSRVVHYEDFAAEPFHQFAKLFSELSLRLPEPFEQLIGEFCQGPEYQEHPYSVRRNSMAEADRWRERILPEEANDVLRGYSKSPLSRRWCPEAAH